MPQPPNMQQMMKQVQQMQADMAKAQEELKSQVVEASAGGGTVTVKVTGDLEVVEVKIDPGAVDPDDVEMLQDLVVAATNEALRSAQEMAAKKLGGRFLFGPGVGEPMLLAQPGPIRAFMIAPKVIDVETSASGAKGFEDGRKREAIEQELIDLVANGFGQASNLAAPMRVVKRQASAVGRSNAV